MPLGCFSPGPPHQATENEQPSEFTASAIGDWRLAFTLEGIDLQETLRLCARPLQVQSSRLLRTVTP